MVLRLMQRLFSWVSVCEAGHCSPGGEKCLLMLQSLILSLFLPFCPVPVSLSSIHVRSTTTTAVLSWKLHRQQCLSTLSLYNTHTQAVTHIFIINSSEEKSQYTVKGLQPGTRFRVKVAVTTFLKHLNMTLKQRLYTGTETGIVQICVYLTDCRQGGFCWY